MKNIERLLNKLHISDSQSLPADFYATILYTVIATETVRKASIFYDYYFHDMTLRQIGEKYNCSGARIREIITKIAVKLAVNPVTRQGLQKYYEAKLDQMTKTCYETGIAQAKKDIETEFAITLLENISINELHLSTWIINALKRAGYHTIGKILKAGPKTIKNLNGMGEHGYRALCDMLLQKFGLDPLTWEIDTNALKAKPASQLEHITIEMLHSQHKLSTRATNALKRSYGSNATVNMVINGGRERLRKSRNIGVATYWEIVECLAEHFGIDRKDWIPIGSDGKPLLTYVTD